MTYRVTAVCLGNICRSPMAEAVIRARLDEAGLSEITVDSAGTDAWHIGNDADPRALQTLRRRGYDLDHTARQFDADWRDPGHEQAPDLVLAMDWSNHATLRTIGVDADRLRMLRSFDPALSHLAHGHGGLEVPDPYRGPPGAFDDVLDMIEAASAGLVDALRRGEVAPGG